MIAMIALLLAAAPAQEVTEILDNQEVEIVLSEDSDCEDSESEELAMNEECEYSDQIVFEDENEVSEDLSNCEDEE